jgi:hypothetical protein
MKFERATIAWKLKPTWFGGQKSGLSLEINDSYVLILKIL